MKLDKTRRIRSGGGTFADLDGIDWAPSITVLLQHLRATATSAFLLGGLLNDLERSSHRVLQYWHLVAVRDRAGEIVACAAFRFTDGLCLLHGTHPGAVRVLAETLDDRFLVAKLSGEADVVTEALASPRLQHRVVRDQREHFMVLRAYTHRLQPDGNYRLADVSDIPRLEQYARGYSRDQRVTFRRDWRRLCNEGRVFVADALPEAGAGGHHRKPVIASCLLHGTSFGPYVSCGAVYTFPEFRGQGYARRLLTNFSLLAFAAGYDVCLLVDETNLPAIRAYRSVGFVAVDSYREVYLSPDGTMRSIPM